jgi:hypothetical protein
MANPCVDACCDGMNMNVEDGNGTHWKRGLGGLGASTLLGGKEEEAKKGVGWLYWAAATALAGGCLLVADANKLLIVFISKNLGGPCSAVDKKKKKKKRVP